MGFINEKLTAEQREEFAAKNIKNPVPDSIKALKPWFWIMDHEKNMCLIYGGIFKEFYEELYFVFLDKNIIYNIVLKREISCNEITWHIPDSAISGNIIKNEKEYLSDEVFANNLKNALLVYKGNGNPIDLVDDIKVNFNF